METPEFAGLTFHEVAAKSALNKVISARDLPFGWTINPYRGCSHACAYCFARPSHTYLDLGAGRDFERQIVVKVNVVEVLRAELARPSWTHEHVALGSNTDPYQRAEGKYRLMPGIIRALGDSGTPFSILTKGTLLRRDLPLLASVARDVSIGMAMSISVGDDALQQSLEPGAPTTTARLATLAAAADIGFDVSVLMMPILPFLTDDSESLDAKLQRIAEAGAAAVHYGALHLRPGVKEVFAVWLRTNHPNLVDRYRALYGDGSNAARDYRRRLAARIRPLLDKHGLAPRKKHREGRETTTTVAATLATPNLGVVPLF